MDGTATPFAFGTGAPYPGLRSFKRDEALIFFGRDRCIDVMADTLQEQRFLSVLGPSGSGKSSLVRSGLFQFLDAGLARKAGSRWTFLDIGHPRCRPYRALARVTLAEDRLRQDGAHESQENLPASDKEGDFPEAAIRERQDALRRNPMSLLRWWNESPRHPDENLLLLVDQFEELFGYSTPAERDEVETFIDMLLLTASNRELPIYVVLTMRSEFLGGCSLFPGFAEQINRSLSLTPRMTREECREAIVGPTFGRSDFTLDPLLVTALLNDMNVLAKFDSDEDGEARPDGDSSADADLRQADLIARRADQLPLMQHVLNWMWARARGEAEARGEGDTSVELSVADYDAAGRLRGALSMHASEVLGDDPQDALLAERVFRAITDQPSVAARGSAETSAVRRPRKLEEIATETGAGIAELSTLIDRFRADGVSMLTPDPGEPLAPQTEIDISHESIIRQWDRLRDWIRIESDAGRGWQELTRSQREEGRRGVLRGIDLQERQDWWRRYQPHAGWAERYGGGFDDADKFLHRSARAATRRRVMLLGGTAAIVALATISGFSLVATQAANRKAEQQYNDLQKLIQKEQKKSEASVAEADAAKRLAAEARQQAAAAAAQQKLAEQKAATAEIASRRASSLMADATAATKRASDERQRLQEESNKLAAAVSSSLRENLARPQGGTTSDSNARTTGSFLKVVKSINPEYHAQLSVLAAVQQGENANLNLDKAGLAAARARLHDLAAEPVQADTVAAAGAGGDMLDGYLATLDDDLERAAAAFSEAATHLDASGDRLRPEIRAAAYAELATASLYAPSGAADRSAGRVPAASIAAAKNCLLSLEAIPPAAAAADEQDPFAAEGRMVPLRGDIGMSGEIRSLCASIIAAGDPKDSALSKSPEDTARLRSPYIYRSASDIYYKSLYVKNISRLHSRREDYYTNIFEILSPDALNISNSIPMYPSYYSDTMTSGSRINYSDTLLSAINNLESMNYVAEIYLREPDRDADQRPGTLDPVHFIAALSMVGDQLKAASSRIGLSPSAAKRISDIHFRTSDNQLAALRRVTPEGDSGFANAFQSTMNSLRQNVELLKKHDLVDARDRRVRIAAQAAALVDAAFQAPQDLYYGTNIFYLNELASELCGGTDGPDCAALDAGRTRLADELANILASAKPAPPLTDRVWTDEGSNIAIGGLDIVSCASAVGHGPLLGNGEPGTTPFSALSDSMAFAPTCNFLGKYTHARRTGDLVWLFASEEAADEFAKNPNKYVPGAGGYELGGLLAKQPTLVMPTRRSLLLLHTDGRLYYYDETNILSSLMTDEAARFAEDAYRRLAADPARKIEPFTGKGPYFDSDSMDFPAITDATADAADDAADAADAAADAAPSTDSGE